MSGRIIKTRNHVKGIKVLNKSVALSKRMKDSFVRTKEKAEETQNQNHASPEEYATGKVQDTAQGTVRNVASRFQNPRQKARDNLERAKEHFSEAKRQLPMERQRAAAQAKNNAVKTKGEADKLRNMADNAKSNADGAKTAVKDAKQTLREVKQDGRRSLREVKATARADVRAEARNQNGVSHPNSKPSALANKTPKVKRDFIQKRAGSSNVIKKRIRITANKPSGNAGNIGNDGVKRNMSETRFKGKRMAKSNYPTVNTANKPVTATVSNPARSSVPRRHISPIKNIVNTGKVGNGAGKGAVKTTRHSAKTVADAKKGIKQTSKGIKQTAKGTIKTAKKTIKTAERTARTTVKTAQQAAKTAQTTAKAAKIAERTARIAAKTAAQAAKAAVKVVTAMVKATIAAVKGLVALIAAGGWVAVLVILVICLIGLFVGSVFGIFFSDDAGSGTGGANGTGQTINTVIAEINDEYIAQIDDVKANNMYDLLDMSGAGVSGAVWKNVLAVYTVKTATDPDNPMEVSTMDDAKAAILRAVFWDMNSISHTLADVEVEEDVIGADGLPAGEVSVVTKAVLRITVANKTPSDMAVQYGFSAKQLEWLDELLKPDYISLWNALLYGTASVGDGSMISVAETQIGNVGGEPYWSWHGFAERVEWCACFVSWCANELGYIDAGIMPKFSGCQSQGIPWFQTRGQWQDSLSSGGGYTPKTGDIIFFDWDGDGISDHVGIVECVESEFIHTIEGNTSDSVARRSYRLDSGKIVGYGLPVFS